MKFCKTAQIQIIGEKEKIKETVNRYLGAMNYISQYAKENDIYSKNRLQKHIYYGIREFFGLKSQMTINALGDVASTYKGKHKKNRFRDKPVEFQSKSMRLNYPRDGQLWLDYEFILIFKKLGTNPKVTPEQKKKSRMTKQERNTYFRAHWNFGGARQDDHPAPFSAELPKRLIKMYSFWGETVCDPFLGSGTTLAEAKKLERSCVGYDINETYLDTIKKKTNWGTANIFTKTNFKIKKRKF